MSRHQQQQWAGTGVYTESVLATLIITRHFGQRYLSYQISHLYGFTTWYKMLLYCVCRNCNWSMVAIFVTTEHYIALRVDPLLHEMVEATTGIIQHLHWAPEQDQHGGHLPQRKMNLLIDIRVPPFTDRQSCGLRVLQYLQILGALWAQQSAQLDTFPEAIHESKLREINASTTHRYYASLRQLIRS
jgi:hypothetical protein